MYDHLLKHFLSTDALRPALMQANQVDGYVYASDGYHLVRIPAGLLAGAYPAHEKAPNFLKIWPTEDRFLDTPLPVAFEAIQTAMKHIPLEDVHAECDECQGTGRVECKCCHNYTDCEFCDGSGLTNKVIGQQLAEYPIICFNNSILVQGRLLLNLLKCIEATQQPAYWLTNSENDTASLLFKTAEIEVLLMPRSWASVSHELRNTLIKINVAEDKTTVEIPKLERS